MGTAAWVRGDDSATNGRVPVAGQRCTDATRSPTPTGQRPTDARQRQWRRPGNGDKQYTPGNTSRTAVSREHVACASPATTILKQANALQPTCFTARQLRTRHASRTTFNNITQHAASKHTLPICTGQHANGTNRSTTPFQRASTEKRTTTRHRAALVGRTPTTPFLRRDNVNHSAFTHSHNKVISASRKRQCDTRGTWDASGSNQLKRGQGKL